MEVPEKPAVMDRLSQVFLTGLEPHLLAERVIVKARQEFTLKTAHLQ